MPHLSAGTILGGDFTIVAPLSSGGMGEVYVAEQKSTGGRRAIKVMRAELLQAPKFRERFEQEARIGARIESEHVVQVISAGIDEASGTPYMAMELLDGEDLRAHVESRGALPQRETAELFEQICHAIAAAHAINVIHRDIKPDNVFVCRSRRADRNSIVKILDFGVAKVVAEASAKGTAAVGTPTWMAPEQGETFSSRIGPRTDVWALGLLAFYTLTGKVFWLAANTRTADVARILQELIIDPLPRASDRARELAPSVRLPEGFDAWFERCVTREPSDRFASVAELEAELHAVLGGDPARVAAKRARAAAMTPRTAPRSVGAEMSTQMFLESHGERPSGAPTSDGPAYGTMPVGAQEEKPPDTLPPPTMRDLPIVEARPLIPVPPARVSERRGPASKRSEMPIAWIVLVALVGLGIAGAYLGLR